jgi:hypothetical protein
MDDKIIPDSRKSGPDDPRWPATCAFFLQGLAARLDRIQGALVTVEEPLRKQEDLTPINAVVELCEESVRRESADAHKLAKFIAPDLFEPEEAPTGQPLN